MLYEDTLFPENPQWTCWTYLEIPCTSPRFFLFWILEKRCFQAKWKWLLMLLVLLELIYNRLEVLFKIPTTKQVCIYCTYWPSLCWQRVFSIFKDETPYYKTSNRSDQSKKNRWVHQIKCIDSVYHEGFQHTGLFVEALKCRMSVSDGRVQNGSLFMFRHPRTLSKSTKAAPELAGFLAISWRVSFEIFPLSELSRFNFVLKEVCTFQNTWNHVYVSTSDQKRSF